MTDPDLPTSFDPDAADDLAAWRVTTDPAAAACTCPWCSAELPDPAAAACPSCGATLTSAEEVPVPGVTTLDAVSVLRAQAQTRPRRRRGVLGWLTGDDDVPSTEQSLAALAPTLFSERPAPPPDVTPARPSPGSLAPPDVRIRREMERLRTGGAAMEDAGGPAPDTSEPAAEAAAADGDPGPDASPDPSRDR